MGRPKGSKNVPKHVQKSMGKGKEITPQKTNPNVRKFYQDYRDAVDDFFTNAIQNTKEPESDSVETCPALSYLLDIKKDPKVKKDAIDALDNKVTFLKRHGIEEVTTADLGSPAFSVIKGDVTPEVFNKLEEENNLGEIYERKAKNILRSVTASMDVDVENVEKNIKIQIDVKQTTSFSSIPIVLAFVSSILRRI